MRKLFLGFTIALLSTAAYAEHVNGYTRSNGTYVQGYERSDRDGTVTKNYSYYGNQNPSTGSTGDNYYRHDTTSQYYNGTPDSQGNYGHSRNNGSYYR
jgi:hypothetical protein